MIDYISQWLDYSSLRLDDSLIFIVCVIIASIMLSFLLDVIRFIMYYISGIK